MDDVLRQVSLGPNLDTLHLLCSAFGEVAKIAVFEKTTGLQALVQVGMPLNGCCSCRTQQLLCTAFVVHSCA